MPSEPSSSREEIRFHKGKSGPTLGVMQTRSQNQRNPNAPTFEERSIGWTLSTEENARTAASLKNACTIAGSCSENRKLFFFKPGPPSNVSSLSKTASKDSELIIVDSEASLHLMSRSDLTPEEQETTQKSKDPSDIMTANGTTDTTEETPVKTTFHASLAQARPGQAASPPLPSPLLHPRRKWPNIGTSGPDPAKGDPTLEPPVTNFSDSFALWSGCPKKCGFRNLHAICPWKPNLLTVSHFGAGVRKRGGTRNLQASGHLRTLR